MASKDLMYSAYEVSCLMDSKRVCSDLLSSILRIIAINSINYSNYVNDDLYSKLKCARDAVEDLANELQITLYNIEDGYTKKEN